MKLSLALALVGTLFAAVSVVPTEASAARIGLLLPAVQKVR